MKKKIFVQEFGSYLTSYTPHYAKRSVRRNVFGRFVDKYLLITSVRIPIRKRFFEKFERFVNVANGILQISHEAG